MKQVATQTAKTKRKYTKRQPVPTVVEVEQSPVLGLVGYRTDSKIVESSFYNENAIRLIRELPKMVDEELKQVFTSVNEARRLMFVINGATSYEIYKRASERGETFTTKKGMGISELFRDLSMSSGLDISTLRDDFRIWDEFNVVILDYLANIPERILPREFWLLAVKAPNPQATLKYFESQRDSLSYYVQHARRDTKKLNQGMSLDQVLKEDIEERAEYLAGLGSEQSSVLTPANADSTDTDTTDTTASKSPKLVTVGLPETPETLYYVRQIIEKYGSFSGWFSIRSKEEFGEVSQDD